jgi:multidrug efflux pump subunit AcrA (membrane-fusion protein)
VRRGQLTGVRVVAGDRTVLRWVRLGRTLGDRVEVLSGLEPGERIMP